MDTSLIRKLLKGNSCFRGVYARNTLPKKVKKLPAGFVVNTDPIQLPGQHWVSIFIDKNGVADYFDSYGLPPLHKDFLNFLENNSTRWSYSKYPLQAEMSMVCGFYAILFLRCRCLDIDLHNFIRIFSNDNIINDLIVQLYTLLS
jgi:hypothetical protein